MTFTWFCIHACFGTAAVAVAVAATDCNSDAISYEHGHSISSLLAVIVKLNMQRMDLLEPHFQLILSHQLKIVGSFWILYTLRFSLAWYVCAERWNVFKPFTHMTSMNIFRSLITVCMCVVHHFCLLCDTMSSKHAFQIFFFLNNN